MAQAGMVAMLVAAGTATPQFTRPTFTTTAATAVTAAENSTPATIASAVAVLTAVAALVAMVATAATAAQPVTAATQGMPATAPVLLVAASTWVPAVCRSTTARSPMTLPQRAPAPAVVRPAAPASRPPLRRPRDSAAPAATAATEDSTRPRAVRQVLLAPRATTASRGSQVLGAPRARAASGGGVFIAGGTISLYNVTVALNSSGAADSGGVFQTGGSLKAYNSLFADNGYGGSGAGPTGADYNNSASGTGSAVGYNSLFQSSPVGVVNGGNLNVGDAGLDPAGLQRQRWANDRHTDDERADRHDRSARQQPGHRCRTESHRQRHACSPISADMSRPPAPGTSAPTSRAVPAPAPTATLTAANVSVSGYGQDELHLHVTYTGAAGITPSSLAGAIVTVDPPGGHGGPITATVVTTVANGPTDPWGDAQSFTVTYSITPPGGSGPRPTTAPTRSAWAARRSATPRQHDPERPARYFPGPDRQDRH